MGRTSRLTEPLTRTRIWRYATTFVMLLFMTTVSWSQTVTVVTPTGGTALGNTNGTGADPVCRYFNSLRYQVHYTAAELTAAGIAPGAVITKIAWNVTEASGTLANYTVRMANTTQANGASHNAVTTTIVKNAFSYATATGYNDITLDAPFTWDGTNNLLVEVCTGTTNPFTTPYGGVQARTGYTTGAPGARAFRVDGSAACATNTSSTVTNKPVIRLTWTGGSACSGTPNPGNTVASPTALCIGSSVALSVQNTTSGSGVTRQWQSSSDNVSWSNITGATSATYSASPTVATWYRCNVTCSGNTGTSTPVQVTINPFTNCYCNSIASSTADEEITNVTIGSLNNTSTCATVAPGPGSIASRYGNYKSGTGAPAAVTLIQGATATGTVTVGSCGTFNYTSGLAIFVDLNQDGDYLDAGEKVYSNGATANINCVPATIQAVNFTIPATATPGLTTMRIMSVETSSGDAITPCMTYTYGETEDYMVNIVAPPAVPANPTATTTGSCISGETLTMTGTAPAGVTYYWQSAATGTDLTNSSATLVVYAPGTYYVRAYDAANNLWSNGAGSVAVNSFPVITPPTAITSTGGNPACVSTTLQLGAAPSGFDYFWQGNSAVTTSSANNATSDYAVSTAGTYYARAYETATQCWSAPTSLVVTLYSTPSGTATFSSPYTCSSTSGDIIFNVNGAGTVFLSDFSTPTLPAGTTSQGNDFNASDAGRMRLTSNANSKNGGVLIPNNTGLASNQFQIDFDMITTPSTAAPAADGFSYSYGPDVVALPSGTPTNPENGSGTALKLSFDAYTNGANTAGIYLMYNCNVNNQAPATAGVLYYNPTTTWVATATAGTTTHVTIKINAIGKISMWLNGVQVVTDQSLPAAYLTADKSTWKHAFCARTGGLNQGHYIDNLDIHYNIYEYSSDNGATWSNATPMTVPAGTYTTKARYAGVTGCEASTGTGTITVLSAPTVTASAPATICPSTNFTLTSTYTYTGAAGDLTFQWERSTDGGTTWSNVAGATTGVFTTAQQTVASKYRCQVAWCGNAAVATNAVDVALTSFQNCYCVSNATSTADEEISNVTLGTLNNSSICTTLAPGPGSVVSQYSNYTSGTGAPAAPNLVQGTGYPISITQTSCGGAYGNIIGVWIDYNQNGLFTDAGENVFAPAQATGNQTKTGTVTIPLTAVAGLTRMRVVNVESTVVNPCGTYTWGETEDYLVNIIPVPANPANPTQTSSNATCTLGETLEFTGSPAAGINWYWQTAANGTSTANGASPYTVYANGTYYVRAYDATNNVWSIGAGSVVVSSLPSPTVAIPATVVACNGVTSQINITSGASSFDSFTWAPTTNLYTDAAGTVAYTGGSASSVYFMATTNGAQPTITLTAVNSGDGCSATSNTVVTVNALPVAPVIAASAPGVCLNGTVNLNIVTGGSGFCGAAATSTADEEITNVTLGTLNNASTCATVAPGAGSVAARYGNYTSGAGAPAAPSFTVGTPVTGTVTVASCGTTNYTSGLAIFIDLNQDGDFSDVGENVWTNGALANINCVPATNVPISFNIPATALSGTTRMRIINAESIAGNSINGCTSPTWGEVEDYNVNIVGGVTFTYAWNPAVTGSGLNVTSLPLSAPTTFTATVNNGVCTSLASNAVTVDAGGSPVAVPTALMTVSTYGASSATSAGDEDIFGVTFGTLNNTSNCSSIAPGAGSIAARYGNYTSLPAPVITAGTATPIVVDVQTCGGFYGANVAVYIDYNQDGDFTDVGENALPSVPVAVLGNVNGLITVPTTAYNGNTRMRVIMVEGTISGPTGTYTWGETEDYTINITGASANIPCPGSTFNLAANVTGGATPYTYAWTVTSGTATIASASAGTTTAVVTADATFQLVVTDACGISNTTTVSTNVAESTIAVSPTTITVCGNPGTTFTASGGSNYSWTPATPAAALNTTSGATVIAYPTATTTYTVTGTYGANCTGTATAELTYVAPPFTVSVTNSNPVLCGVAAAVNLDATVTGGGSYTYTWSENGSTTLASTSGANVVANITNTPTSTSYVYSLLVDDGAGCSSTTNTGVSFFNFTDFTPTANTSSSPANVCEGSIVALASGLSNEAFSVTTTTYAWETAPVAGLTYLAQNGVAATPLTSGSLDDGGWGAVPIGFDFNFFGTNYTSVNVGTNGMMQFGTYNAAGLGDFTITGFPNPAEPTNAIAVVACDHYYATTGSIRYWVTGVAPTRKFVVEYNGPGYISNGTITAQAHIFESTGIVEVHVQQATSTAQKTVGVQDATGTVGSTAPGFNATGNTTIANQAYRFNPPVNYTFAWSAVPSAGTTIATPTASGSNSNPAVGTTEFFVAVTNPLNGCVSTDSVTITLDPATVGGTVTVDNALVCGGNNSGTITLAGNVGNVVEWEYSVYDVTSSSWGPFLVIANTTNTESYSNITATRRYRAKVQSGSCSTAYSTEVDVNVTPYPQGQLDAAATDCQASNAELHINVLGMDGYTGTYSGVMSDGTTFTGSASPLIAYTSTVETAISITSLTADLGGCTTTSGFIGASSITLSNFYADNDNDTYGAVSSGTSVCPAAPGGFVLVSGDCDDASAAAYPEAPEVCNNGIDESCDGGDEICAGDAFGTPVVVNTIGQFGTGSQFTSTVNLATATGSIQSPGLGNDVWYSFVAANNAVRIALTGSTTVADDNDLGLYNNPVNPNIQLIPIATENDVHPGAQGAAADGGNETLLYGNLTVGSTYYICVRNNNNTPGTCGLMISYLRGSQADIGPYTNYTGVYTNTCQNFKAAFRANASGYTVKRWADNTATGTPTWTYSIPSTTTTANTICQLGKILPANMTGAAVNHYVTVDVSYNLPDAFGNLTPITANGIVISTVGLNSEAALFVRTSDQCPVFKSATSGSVATNRSVCGTDRYNWQFVQVFPTPGLPVSIDGPLGASRILTLASVSGIANGQRYDVKVRSKHTDGVSMSSFATTASCVKTTGAAGMTLENTESIAQSIHGDVVASIFPNPNSGQSVNLTVVGMEGDLQLRIMDATGRLVYTNRYVVEGSINTSIEFGQTLAGGVYMVEMIQNGEMQTMRMVVNR